MLREQVAQLRAAGFDADFVGVDRGATAADVTAAALAAKPYDVVLIGAGLLIFVLAAIAQGIQR
jgi:hypothetical protein